MPSPSAVQWHRWLSPAATGEQAAVHEASSRSAGGSFMMKIDVGARHGRERRSTDISPCTFVHEWIAGPPQIRPLRSA